MDLDTLRRELADVDREILTAVARRQELSGKIGRIKRAAGAEPRDYVQEREVVQRAHRFADDLGLPPDLAERLMLLLIRSSLTVQEREGVAAGGLGSGKRALVIGGRGKMGGWFVQFLASQAYAVEVADPAGPIPGYAHRADWDAGELDHEIIVVAAPIRESGRILEALAARRPRGLVFDIGSLKTPLHAGLRALVDAGTQVTSVHPMFGPDTRLLSGRHVIFVDVGVPEAVEKARELFASTMASRIDMDLEQHDRLIGYVLGLSHALNIAFFSALADSGEDAPKLDQLSSTTFDQQLRIAGSVAQENPQLYFEIQALNDRGAAPLAALEAALGRLREVVRSRDEAAFVTMMERGREYLSGLDRRR